MNQTESEKSSISLSRLNSIQTYLNALTT